MPQDFILNLYAPNADLKRARAMVAARFPNVEEDEESGVWAKSRVTIGKWFGRKRLTVVHAVDRDAWEWKEHLRGMQGYFSQTKMSTRLAAVLGAIGKFQFSLAFILDPPPSSSEEIDTDPRAALVFELAKELGGAVFLPGMLLDPEGRLLFHLDGSFDPEARCENLVEKTVASPAAAAEEEAEVEPEPPSAERVMKRCLVFAAVAFRGVIERDVQQLEHPMEIHHQLLRWIEDAGFEDELEDEEAALLNVGPGDLPSQEAVNCLWRVEALEVLAWALQLKDLPAYDVVSDVDTVFARVGVLDEAIAKANLAEPSLRPMSELEEYRKFILGLHWRLREYGVRPDRIDFRATAAKFWAGPLDVSKFVFVENELAIGGRRLDQLDEATLATMNSIATERHIAANWLLDGGVYSKTDQST